MTTDCGSCPAELRPEWIMLKLRHDPGPGTLESGDTAPVIISGENSVIAKPRSESQDQDLVSWLLTELVIRQIIMVWSHRATWTYPKPGRAGARWQLAGMRELGILDPAGPRCSSPSAPLLSWSPLSLLPSRHLVPSPCCLPLPVNIVWCGETFRNFYGKT